MIVAVVLFAYAMALPLIIAPALYRCRVFDRAPRPGILTWHVLPASMLLSLVLGGMALLVPAVPVSAGLAEFLEACAVALRQRYASPSAAVLGGIGLALALSLLLHVGYHLVRAVLVDHRRRGAHRAALTVAGRTGPQGTTVLEHGAPVAYCLPGRGRRVVLTTGALDALAPEQLRAVLAHEHAHLRGRHHLAVLLSETLAAAFPRSRTMRTAQAEVSRLIELAADDAAVRRSGRFALAEALLALNGGSDRPPAATLAAGGSTAAHRVRRLIDAQPPLRWVPSLLTVLVTACALLVPVAVATGPALTAMGTEFCPLMPGSCR